MLTPVWQIPYPCNDDVVSSTIFCDFADAIDAAVTAVDEQVQATLRRPTAKLLRLLVAQNVAINTTTALLWEVEHFDNSGVTAIGAATANVTISQRGVYQVTFGMASVSGTFTLSHFSLIIAQNGVEHIRRKFKPFDVNTKFLQNNVSGLLVCEVGDVLQGRFHWNGTVGPIAVGDATFGLTKVCDL